MGLVSRQSAQRVDAPVGVGIVDIIEMKQSLQIAHAPGVVAVLDSFPSAAAQTFVGRDVRLLTPAGRELAVRVDAVREHGTTISFFFRGLTKADIPVGSRLEFND